MVQRKGHFYLFSVACRNAQQVFLVGDFNNWSTTAAPMTQATEHLWQLALPLAPGEYRFGYFVVNTAWFSDENTTGATPVHEGCTSSKLVVPERIGDEVLN